MFSGDDHWGLPVILQENTGNCQNAQHTVLRVSLIKFVRVVGVIIIHYFLLFIFSTFSRV